jgi:YgiT-type zinc finger domain-containing protein
MAACPRCEKDMRPATVKTAIWRDDRLFVIEDIPAQFCDSCREQFYAEDTTEVLRRLTADGFRSLTPIREIQVPIFSLKGLITPPAAPPQDEAYADY